MDGRESWTIKKDEGQRIDAFKLWCWRRLLRVPLNCKEIKLVNPKGNQPWIFIGRTDAEAEAPILWPPDVKSWLIGKDPDAGKDWRREEKGETEDEMVGWHHQLNGDASEQTPGVDGRQGGLACCSPWGLRVRHNWETELNWTDHHPNLRSAKSESLQKAYFLDSKCVICGVLLREQMKISAKLALNTLSFNFWTTTIFCKD